MLTPNELARTLGISGLQFRNWLRERQAADHPLLRGHIKHQRYEFSDAEADQLLREYRSGRSSGAPATPVQLGHPGARDDRAETSQPSEVDISRLSNDPGHRVQAEWMGQNVVTLEDLLRPGLLAVVIGINPAPVSVAAGHYWQGNTGRTLWRRLHAVGLLPGRFEGYEDDAALAAGVGFTDVVKRPTGSAVDLSPDELRYGLADLERKLAAVGPPLVIFAFKQAATTLLGDFPGNGLIPGLRVGSSEVFVMPGPYEKAEKAEVVLDTLRERIRKLDADRRR